MASNLQDDPLIIRNKAALSALIALQLLSFNAPLAAKTVRLPYAVAMLCGTLIWLGVR